MSLLADVAPALVSQFATSGLPASLWAPLADKIRGEVMTKTFDPSVPLPNNAVPLEKISQVIAPGVRCGGVVCSGVVWRVWAGELVASSPPRRCPAH